MKKLGIGIVVVFVVSALAFSVFAQEKTSPFIGDPDETYYMCVMVSGVEYWFPVYEMFKTSGTAIRRQNSVHRNPGI